jgi:hydrogenase maturation protein HypF
MACAWLVAALGEQPPVPPALEGLVDPTRWRQVAELARRGLSSPETTSMGRLFDALAALCGVRASVNYEGQAAIELEALAALDERGAYALEDGDGDLLDARPTMREAAADLERGMPPAIVSARFHNAVARATAEASTDLAGRHGVEAVVLSGGVFQNRLLLERTAHGLAAAGLRVLVPERLPPNDGGVAYGQAAVVAAAAG